MNNSARQSFFFGAFVLCTLSVMQLTAYNLEDLINGKTDLTINTRFYFRPEMFWGKNISMLNDNDLADRIVFARHTFDFEVDALAGKKAFCYNIVEFKLAARNKAVWGNPNSVASTTESPVKLVDTVFGAHRHDNPRLFMWMRELWLSFSMGDVFGLSFANEHDFTIGAFPFQLGRGIALGDAYELGYSLLGLYTENAVDQFAFGGLFSGDFVQDKLSYDFYAAILKNKSSNTFDTNEKILGQQFGRLRCPARGYGKINYIIAARLNWDMFNTEKCGKMHVEPYLLYNDDPEQRIEFLGDASMKLGTIGLAAEYTGKPFEFGFDTAVNFGRQNVKGWDRNHVEITSNDSFLQQINTNVVDQDDDPIPFVSGSEAQTIIYSSPQDADQNGKQIGSVPSFGGLTVDPVILYNSSNRFRNPFTNYLKGWMAVADAGYWIYQKELFVAATGGFATGDENPNFDATTGDYDGFVGLQEIYSGKRVKSAFLMGGAGKIKRPVSSPNDEQVDQAPSLFPTIISGFTNLVFTGGSLLWKPQGRKYEFSFMPNILCYWQEFATRAFDLSTKKDSPSRCARNFLGTEVNTFASVLLLKSLKGYFVGSVFIPGGHYKDIRGKPLNREQQRALDILDRTGFNDDNVPNIGADVAVTLNFGIEYSF